MKRETGSLPANVFRPLIKQRLDHLRRRCVDNGSHIRPDPKVRIFFKRVGWVSLIDRDARVRRAEAKLEGLLLGLVAQQIVMEQLRRLLLLGADPGRVQDRKWVVGPDVRWWV